MIGDLVGLGSNNLGVIQPRPRRHVGNNFVNTAYELFTTLARPANPQQSHGSLPNAALLFAQDLLHSKEDRSKGRTLLTEGGNVRRRLDEILGTCHVDLTIPLLHRREDIGCGETEAHSRFTVVGNDLTVVGTLDERPSQLGIVLRIAVLGIDHAGDEQDEAVRQHVNLGANPSVVQNEPAENRASDFHVDRLRIPRPLWSGRVSLSPSGC